MVTAVFSFLIGSMLLKASVKILVNFRRLFKTGILTEGVIFDIASDGSSETRSNYPIVRFTTSTGEWITHPYRIGIFPSSFKTGSKVKIVYNPIKPSDFLIRSPYSIIVPAIIILAALFFISVGIVRFFGWEI